MKKITKIICSIILISISISCNEEESIISDKSDLQNYIIEKYPNLKFENYEDFKTSKIHPPEPIYINSYEELDFFLSEIKKRKKSKLTISNLPGNDNGISEPTGPEQGGSGTEMVKFEYLVSIMTYINVVFNYSSNCRASDLTSYMSGWVLGTSYTHIGGSINTYNCIVTFNTRGLIHYNLVFEGIGIIFSEPIDLSGTYYRP